LQQQASKAMLKRASEAEKEAKRKAEDNDVEVRKQKLKLAMEESVYTLFMNASVMLWYRIALYRLTTVV
jgi:hypothetical protein